MQILATDVSISTLSLSGKQMPSSVFRQLPRTAALRNDYTLRDDVNYWGTVRYEIRDESNFWEGGLWVVMEQDGVLYRADLFDCLNPGPTDEQRRAVEAARAVRQIPELWRWCIEKNLHQWDAGVKAKYDQEVAATEKVRAQRDAECESIALRYQSNQNNSEKALLGLPQLFIAA